MDPIAELQELSSGDQAPWVSLCYNPAENVWICCIEPATEDKKGRIVAEDGIKSSWSSHLNMAVAVAGALDKWKIRKSIKEAALPKS